MGKHERRKQELYPYGHLEPMSDAEALQALIDYFLGKNWYVVDPLSKSQVNAIAVADIIRADQRRKHIFRR